MISDVFRQFIDSHKTGLGVVELPTSIGKTYSTFECIAKYTADWAEYRKTHKRNGSFRQVIFTTPLKKNLQYARLKGLQNNEEEFQGLREAYRKIGRLDKYDEEVLFLNSVTEILKTNKSLLCGYDNRVPRYIQKLSIFIDLGKKTQLLCSSDLLQDNLDLFEDVKKNASNLYYNLRRELISAYKYENKVETYMTLTNLADTEGFSWIFDLYPDLLIPRRYVLLMSFDKLLSGRVYEEPSCSFISDQFLERKILFIDEFDSTKQTIKKNLAEEQSDHQVDFLQLFHTITSKAKSMRNSDVFVRLDRELDSMESGRNRYSLAKVIERADKRSSTYKLDHSYKTDGELRDNRHTFIFRDNATRTISKTSSNTRVIVRETSENNVSLILCNYKDKLPDDFYLEGTIRWVTGFLKYFANYALRISNLYKNMKNEANTDSAEAKISIEDAFRTYLYKYDISRTEPIPNPQTRLLLSMADTSGFARKRKKNRSHQGYDYYIDGFTYYSMCDEGKHDDDTIINMVDISETAESRLAQMSSSALVIGLSATASVPSVTGNYNLAWMEANLDGYTDVIDEYPELSDEVTDFLTERYQPYIDGKISVKTHIYDNGKVAQNESNLKGDGKRTPCKILAEAGFSAPVSIKIENYIWQSLLYVESGEKNYAALRYFNLMKVIHDFAGKKYMQSLLYLGTKKAEGDASIPVPSGKYVFDKWVINKIICAVNHELKLTAPEDKVDVAFIYSQGFDTIMEEIKERLSDVGRDGNAKVPERLIIISTYQSVGVGQNMQYPAPMSYRDNLVRLTPRGEVKEDTYRDKDIDGIYLGDITNLVGNFGRNRITEKDLIMSIFQAEELNYNGEIGPEVKEDCIKTAFNHLGDSFPKSNPLRYCDSIRSERTRYVIQAIGRIGRSNQRCKEINLYIDQSVFSELHKETLQRRFSSPEMEEITRRFIETRHYILSDEKAIILNRAANTSDMTAEYVNRIRSTAQHEGYWDESDMQWWNEMREELKRHPSATAEEYASSAFIKNNFINNGGALIDNYLFSVNNRYYEHQRIWFGQQTEFETADNYHRPYSKSFEDRSLLVMEMSNEDVRLNIIFKYPGLHEMWVSRGYADYIKPNPYIMSPFLYTEIYKGTIGETAGAFILNRETGVELCEIADPTKFEKADFAIKERPGEYVDFKYYSPNTQKDNTIEAQKAYDKLASMHGCRLYIINVIKAGSPDQIEDIQPYFEDNKVIILPWMIDCEGRVNKDIKKLFWV